MHIYFKKSILFESSLLFFSSRSWVLCWWSQLVPGNGEWKANYHFLPYCVCKALCIITFNPFDPAGKSAELPSAGWLQSLWSVLYLPASRIPFALCQDLWWSKYMGMVCQQFQGLVNWDKPLLKGKSRIHLAEEFSSLGKAERYKGNGRLGAGSLHWVQFQSHIPLWLWVNSKRFLSLGFSLY